MPRGDKRPTAKRPAPTRRSSEEVRRLVLTSARRLFSLHGYRGTSTRDVATDAGVTAAAIYRHFGSKEGLFEAAVEEPLHSTIEGFLQDWEFLGPDRSNNLRRTAVPQGVFRPATPKPRAYDRLPARPLTRCS